MGDFVHAGDRPARRMPSLKKIAKHLGISDSFPHCFRCRATSESSTWGEWVPETGLERAHVIDRCRGGLDNAANLRPLCHQCHALQPSFGAGQEVEALRWFSIKRSPVVDAVIDVICGTPVAEVLLLDEWQVELAVDADERGKCWRKAAA